MPSNPAAVLPGRPRQNTHFSLVVAIYNVEQYIDEFLDSVDRQSYPGDLVQVVLVDDGSTDSSGEIAHRWAAAHPNRAIYLRQDNAGQGAARNLGLEFVEGEWVTFCDPDDVLNGKYFEEIDKFLADNEQHVPALLATKIFTFVEDPGHHWNHHPLRKNFDSGNTLVDLSRFPEKIHLHGGTSFYRMEKIRELGLRFDVRIRPSFEDAHFVGRYLLDSGTPLVGFIRTAVFYYRKRADASSAIQTGWKHAGKFTDVLRFGHLDLLQRAKALHGRTPAWVQNVVMYDLVWYFRADNAAISGTGWLDDTLQAQFHELVAEIFTYLDDETVLGFRINRPDWLLRKMLLSGYKKPLGTPDYVILDELDEAQNLVRARYAFSGVTPQEEWHYRGEPIEPRYAKTRALSRFGRTLAFERVVWLPSNGTLGVSLDGRSIPLSTNGPIDLPYSIRPEQLRRALGSEARLPAAPHGIEPSPASADEPGNETAGGRKSSIALRSTRLQRYASAQWMKLRRLAQREGSPAATTRALSANVFTDSASPYRDAWVLMDRMDQAQDNAEHFCRYLLRRRPEINAWFVLNRDSADWDRLEAERFKLVAYGSDAWQHLLAEARFVLSSHASAFASNPLPLPGGQRPKWKFIFLQHGVTKDDLSRWLNPKRLDAVVAATPAEAQAFSGDGTPYLLTDREVLHVGFPRHDALLARAASAPASAPRLLIMPSWRRSLTEGLSPGLGAQERMQAFVESEYAHQWVGLLRSEALAELSASSGVRLSFLPHPNMKEFMAGLQLPAHVTVLDWATINIQDVIVQSSALLTDYSSITFDFAFLRKASVYFQFDQDAFYSGAQPFRKGYFDFTRDGFGDVVTSRDELLDSLSALFNSEFTPTEVQRRRIDGVFEFRDGAACSRLYRAVRQLDRPHRAYRRNPSLVSSQ